MHVLRAFRFSLAQVSAADRAPPEALILLAIPEFAEPTAPTVPTVLTVPTLPVQSPQHALPAPVAAPVVAPGAAAGVT